MQTWKDSALIKILADFVKQWHAQRPAYASESPQDSNQSLVFHATAKKDQKRAQTQK